MIGSSCPQYGHSKSPNSTIVTHASLGPRTGDGPIGTLATAGWPARLSVNAGLDEQPASAVIRTPTIGRQRCTRGVLSYGVLDAAAVANAQPVCRGRLRGGG